MRFFNAPAFVSFLFVYVFLSSLSALSKEPAALYATWKDDPSSTMVIFWHCKEEPSSSKILYKELGAESWQEKEGSFELLHRSSLKLYKVELTALAADTEYEFQIEGGKMHRFKTLPTELTKPLKIVIGGDAYLEKRLFKQMNREVAKHAPDFVILGGDIAYSEGLRHMLKPSVWHAQRWIKFFKKWKKQMKTEEERIIPLVPVLGNHDIKEMFDNPFKRPVLFYQVFAFPKPFTSFRAFKVANALCFFLLDTGHSFPVAGAQAEWLEEAFLTHKDIPYKFPVYHIPAYPSAGSFSYRVSQDIRKFWAPLFEKHHVKVAFEHDNHDFKRTFPIKGEKVDQEGVLYLGDGAWGVKPDKPKKHWYLAKASAVNSYWLMTVFANRCLIEGYTIDGEKIDQLELSNAE